MSTVDGKSLHRMSEDEALKMVATMAETGLVERITNLVCGTHGGECHYPRCVCSEDFRRSKGRASQAIVELFADALAAKEAENEALKAEIARLRSIINSDVTHDPELAKIAGKPINVFDAAASPTRKFNPGGDHK